MWTSQWAMNKSDHIQGLQNNPGGDLYEMSQRFCELNISEELVQGLVDTPLPKELIQYISARAAIYLAGLQTWHLTRIPTYNMMSFLYCSKICEQWKGMPETASYLLGVCDKCWKPWVLRDVNNSDPINEGLQNNFPSEICNKCHRIYDPKMFPRNWYIGASAALIIGQNESYRGDTWPDVSPLTSYNTS